MGSVAIFKGKLVKFLAKAGLLMPSRPETERSTSPTAGEIAFNNTTNKLEMFDGSTWITFDNAPSADPTDIAGIPPSLDLDFSADVPSTVTFSRNSIATYFDQDGYLKTASANVPRIEYDPVTRDVKGLLIEEARSNLLVQTEQLFGDKWNVINTTKSITTEIAPDGSTTAVKLIESLDVSSISHYLEYDSSSAVSVTSGITYTISIFAKKGERDIFRLDIDNTNSQLDWNSNTPRALVNLTTKTITIESASATSATITDVGNGWYRCSVTGTATQNGTTRPRVVLYSGAVVNYTGDGKSGLYIWGAQLEAGDFPTSYIPSQQTWTARTGTGGTAVASYYDSTGLLKFTGVARTTYNPDPARLHLAPKLLLEPERTNLLQRSEQFENSYWNKLNITTSSNTSDFVAPDGLNFSDKILETATTAEHYIERLTISTTTNTPYTLSVFVKQLSRRYIGLSVFDSVATNKFSAQFDLTNALVSATGSNGTGTFISASIVPLINGWYRISLTGIPSSTDSGSLYSARIALLGDGPATSYLGDITKGCYLWGAQLEAGYEATSYIPTTTAAVTRYADTYTSAVLSGGRLADNASMTGSNFTGWYRWDEGTVYCEADRASTSSYSTRWHISDSGSNFIRSVGWNDGTDRLCNVTLETVQQSVTSLANATTAMTKYSAAYATNNVSVYRAGIDTITDTSCLIPSKVDRLFLGSSQSGSSPLNGHIRRLIFWPKRLDNTKLQLMTK